MRAIVGPHPIRRASRRLIKWPDEVFGKHVEAASFAKPGGWKLDTQHYQQMGVATGLAAALCEKHGVLPRGVYEKHVKELRALAGYA